MPEKGRFPNFELSAKLHYHQKRLEEISFQEMVKSNSGKPLHYR